MVEQQPASVHILNKHDNATNMSSEGLHRPVIYSVAAIATVATAYLLYSQYNIPNPLAADGLHRSNAVRRPRRQHAEADLTAPVHHPRRRQSRPADSTRTVDRAIERLTNPPPGNTSFGTYHNSYLLPLPSGDEPDFSLDLDLLNLPHLYRSLQALHPEWTSDQQLSLRHHIEIMFTQAFIRTFWREDEDIDQDDQKELITALRMYGIPESVTETVLEVHYTDDLVLIADWNPDRPPIRSSEPADPPQVDGFIDDPMSIDEPNVDLTADASAERGHNMLNLLYHIAREQAKQAGYVHRGVECNSCGACPILGVRYHCSNCFDYDLCETCEAKEVHIKTHVFYKVRIPAPSRGQIKVVSPKWYPGNPNVFPPSLPRPLLERLKGEVSMDQPDIEGIYEQFKCLAGHQHDSDPAHLGMAIDRKAFDLFFIPSFSDRPSPANLIYDRIFAFYDANDDGVIDFLEFIRGITKLQDKSFMAKLRRVFQGYDLDGDGYICRKDFLRLFRAYYDLSTQLNREMLHRHEDMDLEDDIRETVQGNHPISAAFGGNNFSGHLGRYGQDKVQGANGDLEVATGPAGVLQEDLEMSGDRTAAIGVASREGRMKHPFRSFRQEPPRDDLLLHVPYRNNEVISIANMDDAGEEELQGPRPPFHTYGWPPIVPPDAHDIRTALGADVPLEEIDDPVDRSRVIFAQSQRFDAEYEDRRQSARRRAVNDRWRRRHFYLDEEEGMKRPVGYAEPDSSDDDSDVLLPETIDSSRRQSLRSRSSSKVRFDDSAIDTDYETRSNASSRSMTQNERWGGHELSRPTLDVGADVLYGAVQQGFNELIDCLFREKEDLAMAAHSTRQQRTTWKKELDEYAENRDQDEEEREEALAKADGMRTEELLNGGSSQEHFQLSITEGDAGSPEARVIVHQIQREINLAMHEIQVATQKSREPSPKLTTVQEYRDPTLPQFRPDDTSGGATHSKTESEQLPPSTKTLATWLRHQRIDEEAAIRGGHGRLTLLEFRQAIEAANAADRGEPAPVHNKKPKQRADGVTDPARATPATDENDENNDQYWEKSGDLGKLAFLGTWLEMASF